MSWTRNQNGKIITNGITTYSILENEHSKCSIKMWNEENSNIDYQGITMGTYSSEEKAIKVMDMLEGFLKGDIIKLKDSGYTCYVRRLYNEFGFSSFDAKKFADEINKQCFRFPTDEEVIL